LLTVLTRALDLCEAHRDAEPLESALRLGCDRRRAAIHHDCTWQAALEDRLHQGVHQLLGAFLEVPLRVTAHTRASVEHGQQFRHDQRAFRGMGVRHLEAAHFAWTVLGFMISAAEASHHSACLQGSPHRSVRRAMTVTRIQLFVAHRP
jgi:hypothetical protein